MATFSFAEVKKPVVGRNIIKIYNPMKAGGGGYSPTCIRRLAHMTSRLTRCGDYAYFGYMRPDEVLTAERLGLICSDSAVKLADRDFQMGTSALRLSYFMYDPEPKKRPQGEEGWAPASAVSWHPGLKWLKKILERLPSSSGIPQELIEDEAFGVWWKTFWRYTGASEQFRLDRIREESERIQVHPQEDRRGARVELYGGGWVMAAAEWNNDYQWGGNGGRQG